MNSFQDAVSSGTNRAGLFVGLFAPEQEDNSFLSLVDNLDHMICELLPALLLVRVGDTFPYCEDCIKKKDSLASPF